MAKSVAVLADRSVDTLDWASTAPNTVVVLEVLGPIEISLHGTGNTDFRCDRIGRVEDRESEGEDFLYPCTQRACLRQNRR